MYPGLLGNFHERMLYFALSILISVGSTKSLKVAMQFVSGIYASCYLISVGWTAGSTKEVAAHSSSQECGKPCSFVIICTLIIAMIRLQSVVLSWSSSSKNVKDSNVGFLWESFLWSKSCLSWCILNHTAPTECGFTLWQKKHVVKTCYKRMSVEVVLSSPLPHGLCRFELVRAEHNFSPFFHSQNLGPGYIPIMGGAVVDSFFSKCFMYCGISQLNVAGCQHGSSCFLRGQSSQYVH